MPRVRLLRNSWNIREKSDLSGLFSPVSRLIFQLIPGPLAAIANSQVILCFSSQTHPGLVRSLRHMSAKYFTQFRLTDADYRGGNEFSGVVELSRPMDNDSDVTDIEAVLAKNFDLRRSSVQLVSWSRLH